MQLERVAFDGCEPVAHPFLRLIARRRLVSSKVCLDCKVIPHRVTFDQTAYISKIHRRSIRLMLNNAEPDLVSAGSRKVTLHRQLRGKAICIRIRHVYKAAACIKRNCLKHEAIIPGAERANIRVELYPQVAGPAVDDAVGEIQQIGIGDRLVKPAPYRNTQRALAPAPLDVQFFTLRWMIRMSHQ